MNSGNFKEELGLSESREFLHMLKGRNTMICPHFDNIFLGGADIL